MTPEPPRWFTSSYSNNGGDCVEIATNLVGLSGLVPVRDSKAQNGSELHLTAAAFSTFINGLKSQGPGIN